MRRLFALMVLLTTILILSGTALAASKTVAILPVVNNSGVKGGQVLVGMVDDALAAKFSRYQVLSGQYLVDNLRVQGFEDLSRSDASFYAALRNMGADYVVRTELYPAQTRQRVSLSVLMFMKIWIANLPLYCNITDISRGVTVYETVIQEEGWDENFIGFASKTVAVQNSLARNLDRLNREAYIPE